eukprot:scaffold81838_cov72-Phaeocystis_antarctica.AAC.1
MSPWILQRVSATLHRRGEINFERPLTAREGRRRRRRRVPRRISRTRPLWQDLGSHSCPHLRFATADCHCEQLQARGIAKYGMRGSKGRKAVVTCDVGE